MTSKGKQVMGSGSGANKKRKQGSGSSQGSGVPMLDFEARFLDDNAKTRYASLFSRRLVVERAIDLDHVDTDFGIMIANRKWEKLITVKNDEGVNQTLVCEFLANLRVEDLDAHKVWVREKTVKLNPTIINVHYGLGKFDKVNYADDLITLVQDEKDPLDELRELINSDLRWVCLDNGRRKELVTSTWPEKWKLRLRFVQNRLLPKSNISHASIADLEMLYALWDDLDVNVGLTLFDYFYANAKEHRSVCLPRLIQELCYRAGVPVYPTDVMLPQPAAFKIPKYPTKGRSRAPVGMSSVSPVTLESMRREMLLVARDQQVWARMQRKDNLALMANIRDLSLGVQITDPSRFELETESFTYDPAIEEAFAGLSMGYGGGAAAMEEDVEE